MRTVISGSAGGEPMRGDIQTSLLRPRGQYLRAKEAAPVTLTFVHFNVCAWPEYVV